MKPTQENSNVFAGQIYGGPPEYIAANIAKRKAELETDAAIAWARDKWTVYMLIGMIPLLAWGLLSHFTG